MFHLFVLLAAIAYAISALLIKRSADLGVGAIRALLVANLTTAIFFQPFWLLPGEIQVGLWWQPLLAALCYIGGQGCAFWALQKGDVSVATPVLGIKILMVAVLVTVLAGESLGLHLWSAAALATLGVAMLNRRNVANHHHVGPTIIISMIAGAFFALFDVLVQQWSPHWGMGSFVPLTMGLAGLFSVLALPWFRSQFLPLAPAAKPWLAAGCIAVSIQAMLMVGSVAHWGQAAEANVVYSSRGLWSVLLVWLGGHWFHVTEQQLGNRTLAWRLTGALFMTFAVVLVLI